MTRVINLMGAPGAGKSTLAADLFALMKKNYMSAEIVTEYVKDLVYDGVQAADFDQISVFAEQHRRIARLEDKVEWVVTDSPLFLQSYYAMKSKYSEAFSIFIHNVANRYNNVNFLIKRNHPYDPNGRFQTEEQSDQIHQDLIYFMRFWNIPYTEILADDDNPSRLLKIIKEQYENSSNG